MTALIRKWWDRGFALMLGLAARMDPETAVRLALELHEIDLDLDVLRVARDAMETAYLLGRHPDARRLRADRIGELEAQIEELAAGRLVCARALASLQTQETVE